MSGSLLLRLLQTLLGLPSSYLSLADLWCESFGLRFSSMSLGLAYSFMSFVDEQFGRFQA